MREVRLYNRDVHLEQGHFWAHAGDDFYIVARSLADLIVAARQADSAYLAGTSPSWENQTNKVTVIHGLARSIPDDAVEAEPVGAEEGKIHRSGDPASGETPVYWIHLNGYLRAFLTEDHAMGWRYTALLGAFEAADREHLEDLERDVF